MAIEQGGADAQGGAGGHHGETLLNQLRKISERSEKHAAVLTLKKTDIEYTKRHGEG